MMPAPKEMFQLAPATMQPKRWPLVSRLQTRSTIQSTGGNALVPIQNDARLINCYAEYDQEDKEYWIYKRFGISTAVYATPTTPGTSTPLGCYTHPQTGVILYGTNPPATSTEYLYTTATPGAYIQSMTGPLGSGNPPLSYETINSSPQTVMVTNQKQGWLVNTSNWTVTQITDVNFPSPHVPGIVYLDGTTYVMDPNGNIWGSHGLDNAAVWDGLNVIRASSNADRGIAIEKQLNYLIAFKQYTTQVFYDAGNASGSPLSPVPDSQIPLGCLCQQSIQEIDNSILWITANATMSPQVVRMDNLTPNIVSTPAVERILFALTFTDNPYGLSYIPQTGIFSFIFKHAGHRLYGITLNSVINNITLVYDIDQDLWYTWQSPEGNNWSVMSAAAIPPGTSAGLHVVQTLSTVDTGGGYLYTLDTHEIYPNDAGAVFPVDIYTPNTDFNIQRRKTLNAIYFRGDRIRTKIQTRFNDFDYDPTKWSNPRDVDMSLAKPRLTNCGTFEWRRAYHIRHFANTPFRLKTMELQMDLGTL